MTGAPAQRPPLPNGLPRPPGELDRLKAVWALPKGWRILSAVNNTAIGSSISERLSCSSSWQGILRC